MSEPTSSGPSLKRKRANGSDNTEATDEDAVTRSAIWFDDGSIVLQAQTTQFRVHKSLLSRHSSVFRDMFNVPQPESEPTVEGCAVVHVADDPEDWKRILEILYDNVKAYKSTNSVPLPLLSAMLRLGKKYEFDHLQEEAMERLKLDLPKTLDLWDKLYHEGDTRKKRRCDIFHIINLLLELGVQTVLPVAYYACLDVYSLRDILLGAHGSSVDLSPAAKARLVLGREALSRVISDTLEWIKDDKPEECQSSQRCNTHRGRVLRVIVEHWHDHGLSNAKAWVKLYSPPTPFCLACAANIKDKFQATRQRMWDNLPKYFDLPAWGDLKDD